MEGYAWALILAGDPDTDAARLAKAQEAAERAIQLRPLDATGYLRRAQVLRQRGDALAALARPAGIRSTLNANEPLVHAELELNKIGAGLAGEAIAHIEAAIRLSPGHSALSLWYLRAGQAAVHLGDYHGAVA